jgi:SAM-dependent methyltransferase
MADEWDTPIFAFHNLSYIPSGYSGILAPYIETGPGTMRAAAALMRLDLIVAPGSHQVMCDLGCGDGQLLIGLLAYVNKITGTTDLTSVHGVGVDYNAELVQTASSNAILAGENVRWLTYDFNDDKHDLFAQLVLHRVTHIFVYLVPKQLALQTVRRILTQLYDSGVIVCCHKFQPGYLTATRRDTLMDLVVYERA